MGLAFGRFALNTKKLYSCPSENTLDDIPTLELKYHHSFMWL